MVSSINWLGPYHFFFCFSFLRFKPSADIMKLQRLLKCLNKDLHFRCGQTACSNNRTDSWFHFYSLDHNRRGQKSCGIVPYFLTRPLTTTHHIMNEKEMITMLIFNTELEVFLTIDCQRKIIWNIPLLFEQYPFWQHTAMIQNILPEIIISLHLTTQKILFKGSTNII